MVGLILLVASFILFVLATFNVPSKWSLMAAGLACWVLSVLLGGLGAHLH